MKNHSGFTLLELIMVIIIVGVIAALAVPQYAKFVEKTKAAEALNYIGALKKAQLANGPINKEGTIYAQNIEDELGMSSETKYFTYETGGYVSEEIGWGYLIFIATRKDPPATCIMLNYNLITGESTWTGNDIGTPGGPTETWVNPIPV